MQKLIMSFVLCFIAFLLMPMQAFAQVEPYTITNFYSDIIINQDSSINITETIDVFFNQQRHGIYRVVPVSYKLPDRTIDSRFQLISIKDKNGKKYKYKTDREGGSISIRIGDEDEYVTGNKTYIIQYKMRNILQRFDKHDELYWNVAGSNWDTTIQKSNAVVHSNFADVQAVTCFAGVTGSSLKQCSTTALNNQTANFSSSIVTGNGSDLTIVVGLNNQNLINFTPTLADRIYDNWGYAIFPLPLLIAAYLWWKKGRDLKHKGDNIYYVSEDKGVETKSPFAREFLPLVYYPINGLTPSEVGTIVDEQVHTQDVIAEIIELARLGFIKIERVEKKWQKDDYKLIKLKKDTSKLREYQSFLLEKLFSHGEIKDAVFISELKKKFYKDMDSYKRQLYNYTTSKDYFIGNPQTVRGIWAGIFITIGIVAFVLTIGFSEMTGNYLPMILLLLTSPLLFIFILQMPRRSAKGYALYRQVKGLKWFLDKGKWRTDIQEKRLFFEEMLPLAISLGVAKKLAREMDDLGVPAPAYFNTHGAAFYGAFNSFSNDSAGSLAVTPSSSGGSGFSGGSSGGGFGGGGGGSW